MKETTNLDQSDATEEASADERTTGPDPGRPSTDPGRERHGGGEVPRMIALQAATIGCVLANAGIAVADYAKAGFVLKNSAEVHVPVNALPYLATLKLAGAVGLVIGLAGIPWLGVAAGSGLILFFIGAVAAHVRARVFYNIAFPGLYLLLAIAATAHMIDLAIGS